MEKRGETHHLPEEIIHHIQSFLNVKEAARTTILSKSCYEAWLKNPNLVFSEADFPTTTSFMDFGKKTIQRYEQLNLKIQSFKLIDLFSSKDYSSDRISLAEEWIRKSIELGATDINIEILYEDWESDSIFVLPQEVFESQTLVKLSLKLSLLGSSKINLNGKKVNCSRLKSLTLSRVRIEFEGSNNIWDIISMNCPLIEDLELSDCWSGSYEKLVLGMQIFRKLKSLLLRDVEFGEGFFHNFSSKFPCLRELILEHCDGCKEIQICSDSLESLMFYAREFHVLEFDVPRIQSFYFSGSYVPSVSFKTTSTERVSSISFCCWETSCFTKLRKLLQELSPSKIYDLHLFIGLDLNDYDYAGEFISLPKPLTVGNLTIDISRPFSVHSAVLEDLIWSCRPNFLYLQIHPSSISKPLETNSSDIMKLICKLQHTARKRQGKSKYV